MKEYIKPMDFEHVNYSQERPLTIYANGDYCAPNIPPQQQLLHRETFCTSTGRNCMRELVAKDIKSLESVEASTS